MPASFCRFINHDFRGVRCYSLVQLSMRVPRRPLLPSEVNKPCRSEGLSWPVCESLICLSTDVGIFRRVKGKSELIIAPAFSFDGCCNPLDLQGVLRLCIHPEMVGQCQAQLHRSAQVKTTKHYKCGYSKNHSQMKLDASLGQTLHRPGLWHKTLQEERRGGLSRDNG